MHFRSYIFYCNCNSVHTNYGYVAILIHSSLKTVFFQATGVVIIEQATILLLKQDAYLNLTGKLQQKDGNQSSMDETISIHI